MRERGFAVEEQARAFLEKQGLVLVQKNYSAPTGEIDLVMKDQQTIVFVEVRLRSNRNYGSPIDSVNYGKQQKLIRTALLFMQARKWLYKLHYRFDIIGVQKQEEFHWIKNAFLMS